MKLTHKEVLDETQVFFKFIDGGNLLSAWHTHDFYEIFIVTKGQITHKCADLSLDLKQGDMVLIRPWDGHCLFGSKDAEILNMAFSIDVFNAVLWLYKQNISLADINKRRTPMVLRQEGERLEEVKRRCREILAYNGGKSAAAIQYKAVLADLLGRFALASMETDKPIPEWLEKLVKKIRRVEVFTMDIEQIYLLTSKSPEHIARSFRKHMNTSLTEHTLQLRLNYAKELLLNTDRAVLWVCYEAGFNSPSYFHRRFKDKYGVTPAKLRAGNHKKI